MSDAADNFLEHYGVKGMRWGRRKDRSTSSDHAESRTIRKKRLDEMSNDELKKLTTRMDLEQKYAKLNPSKVKKGKAALAGAIATAGMAISIYNIANHPLAKDLAEKGMNAMYKSKAAAGITKAITG